MAELSHPPSDELLSPSKAMQLRCVGRRPLEYLGRCRPPVVGPRRQKRRPAPL